MIQSCSPEKTGSLLQEPACQLLDVREFPEFAAAHVPGARLLPLGTLPAAASNLDKSQVTILLCKGGKRARKAAEILDSLGFTRLVVLEGGTDAWIAAGLPTESTLKKPWALDRQVRLVAGALLLAGLFIPPWPFLSLAVAAGLILSALTNTCTLALLLAKLPHNRPRAMQPTPKSSCCGNQ